MSSQGGTKSREVADVAETLRRAKARGKRCTLLIGAGVSVKAGIPTAAGFVDRIKADHPRAYDRAPQGKNYAACMVELTRSEQRDLIAEYVDEANINWAHICIAQLMERGYVDRVLTTNFDPLVVKACALVGIFPAIYDFAASQLFNAADIPDEAVFYLHGQRTGFVLINTEEQFSAHSKALAPVFEEAGLGRVWVVVGYSGENDPVFDHLARVPRFDNGLYWVGYENAGAAQHVREQLLDPDKDAFYVPGYDADGFFISVLQALEAFPPAFVGKPFEYLNDLFGMLTPFTPPGGKGDIDVTDRARRMIVRPQPAIASK